MIDDAADCFNNCYAIREDIRNFVNTIYLKKYIVKHTSLNINRLQQFSHQSTQIAHKIQFNLRNNDSTEHKKLVTQMNAIYDSVQVNKELFIAAVKSNTKWQHTDFEKYYKQYCWTIKRFCNFAEDYYNQDKFLSSEIKFMNELGEPIFPQKYNACDAMHNYYLISQICDSELMYHQMGLYHFFDVTYLNNQIRYKNNYNSKYNKKGFDTLQIPILDSSNTAVFIHTFREPYVLRGRNKLTKINYIDFQNYNTPVLNNTINTKLKKDSASLDLNFNTIAVGQTIQLKGVLFELSKDILLENSYPTLLNLSTFLKENPTTVILLSGHTDYVGNKKANKKLSKKRVKKVKNYLLSNGIAPNQVKLKWYGGKLPLVKSLIQEERAVNRRVEVSILKK